MKHSPVFITGSVTPSRLVSEGIKNNTLDNIGSLLDTFEQDIQSIMTPDEIQDDLIRKYIFWRLRVMRLLYHLQKDDEIFLKAAFPSRKYTKRYDLKGE
jgi:hypothetical protein